MRSLLTSPMGLGFLLGLAGFALWAWDALKGRRPRRGPGWIAAGWLLAVASSSPAAAHVVAAPLERRATTWPPPPPWADREAPEAIVVFAGGIQGAKAPGAPLDGGSMERVQEAVARARRWPGALVIVSGGTREGLDARLSAGSRMAEVALELGLEPSRLVVETGSRNTYENAVKCAALLRERGIRRVALVTSPLHMVRARAALRKQGYLTQALPPPAPRLGPARLDWILPDEEAAQRMAWAIHEWLGLAWYRARSFI